MRVLIGSVAMLAAVVAQTDRPVGQPTLREEARGRVERAAAEAKGRAQQAVDDLNADVQRWAAAREPGPAHEVLKALEGEWTGAMTVFPGPGAEPLTSTGAMSSRFELGGRWLRSRWTGEAMGEAMEGVAYFGHDNARGVYLGTWIDTFTTGMLRSEGTYDEPTRTFTMRGTMPTPDGPVPIRQTTVIESPDRHRFELFAIGPDGAETLMTRVVYTRRK